MIITKYNEEHKAIWDAFIAGAKNGHFFFQRDYMDYHKQIFTDHSLMIYDNNKLIAVLPANIDKNILYSHQGLTFGGFIVNDKMKTEIMLVIFQFLKEYLKNNSIDKMEYKCIPYNYHIKPSEEDRYALFLNNARLIRRDVCSVIYLQEPFRYSKSRKITINEANKNNFEIFQSNDYDGYWKLLTDLLKSKYGSKPVHSLEEIKKLAGLFPDNIKLFLAQKNKTIVSGTLIYENENIAHTQYLASSQWGRELGCLDILLDHLIKNVYNSKKYFSLGISNENAGKYLNTGLISYKEGFGARAVCHDFYELYVK